MFDVEGGVVILLHPRGGTTMLLREGGCNVPIAYLEAIFIS